MYVFPFVEIQKVLRAPMAFTPIPRFELDQDEHWYFNRKETEEYRRKRSGIVGENSRMDWSCHICGYQFGKRDVVFYQRPRLVDAQGRTRAICDLCHFDLGGVGLPLSSRYANSSHNGELVKIT